MSLLRATVELRSSICTPLKGDTIWGHVACGIANHEGDEGVKAFCNLDPPFVVSSAFPHNMLPKPLLEPIEPEDFKTKEDYVQYKKEKKSKYITASSFLEIKEDESIDEIKFKSMAVTHVSISRLSGTALDGMLYSVDEKWPDCDRKMDLYISTTFEKERVLELLNWAFEFGYGADATTGKGAISVSNEILEIKQKHQYTGTYMALGPFVANGDVLSNLRGTTFIRKGRIGGVLSTELTPYKKSIIFYDEGSTFKNDGKIEYVGAVLHNMHYNSNYDICHSGLTPVIEV